MNTTDFTCVEAMKDHLEIKPKDIIHVGTWKGSKVDVRKDESGERYVLRLGIVSNFVSSPELAKLISYINENMPDLEFAGESNVEPPVVLDGPSPAFLLETLRSFYEGKMGYVSVSEHVCLRPVDSKSTDDLYEMVWDRRDETEGTFKGTFSDCLATAENVAKNWLRVRCNRNSCRGMIGSPTQFERLHLMNLRRSIVSLFVVASSILFCGGASAGDVRGAQKWSGIVEVGVSQTRVFKFTFRAGEVAAIIVKGDGDGDIDCIVRDESGNLLAIDNDSTDTCLLRFRPSRTGDYIVGVQNNGKEPSLAVLETN